MRRWISGLITVGVIAGAGVVGLSTIADAVPGGETGVDCGDPKHADNPQCQESFDETGGSNNTKGCENSKPGKNPHCQTGGTTGDTTVTTSGGGSSGGGSSGGGTTASTAATAGAGGGQSTQVAGVVVTPGAAPTPGAPAPAQAAQPRFTG